jgi:hypothetical protein
MPCFVVALVLLFPRIVILALFFFSNYIGLAYQTTIVPVLGFFFLPITTLTYAWMVNSSLPLEGLNVFILVIAVILDASSWGSGEYNRRRG